MNFNARVIRKLSLAGLPLPGLLHPSHRNPATVYLTFDDGPSPTLTPHVLDVLTAHGAKATFFVCGQRVEQHPHIADRIRREGHTLANHTFTHPALTKLAHSAALAEVERCQAIIAPLGAGRLFRPTHGLIGLHLFLTLVRRGYRIVFWSLDCGDWQPHPEAELAAQLVDRVRGGDTVLFHDDQPNSIRILELFLAGTGTDRFHFAPLP